jgi:hypothetical protein
MKTETKELENKYGGGWVSVFSSIFPFWMRPSQAALFFQISLSLIHQPADYLQPPFPTPLSSIFSPAASSTIFKA